jgi:multidrug efflux pump subunit AcrB
VIVSNVAIRNRTTVLVACVLIVIVGAVSYALLPRESFPDVELPVILITTTQDGVSPEDIETTITGEIEQQLAGMKGLKEMTSTSAEGVSTISCEFYPDVDIEAALQRVRDKVDLAKADVPAEADESIIQDINVSEFPIMLVNVSGTISPVRLKEIADRMEDEIESIPGVLNVDIIGALEPEIRLEMDRDRLAAYGLTISEVLNLIPSENVNVSAGGLETAGTKFNIRLPAEFEKPEQVQGLQIAVRDGRPIYLSDVATVRGTFKDRLTYSRLDGKDSITVSIQKRTGANIIPIADTVKAMLAEFRGHAPRGTQFDVTLDQSDDIRMMVADLENNIVSGFVLVLLVLVLFMGWRTSFIVALAIPMSMLMSFAVLSVLGYTLNMIVLFSLILALGMLVDNAIVIVENIFRHTEMGYGRVQAAMKGAGEVAWPVITSTATTVAAFMPLMFWPGIVGDVMKYLPITVTITLISSLFVAMVISPTVCSVFAGGKRHASREPEGRVKRLYRKVLGLSIRNWYVTLSLSALLMIALAVTYARRGNGQVFFPDLDPQRAMLNIRAPQGTNIAETDRIARLAEARLKPFSQYVEHVITNVGSSGGGTLFETASGTHVATLTIEFHPFEDRVKPSAEAIEEMRKCIADIPGAEIQLQKQREGPPTGAPVTVEVIGRDFKTLERLSARAKAMIADVPGLVNLKSDLEATRPEIVFEPDRRKAVQLGVNTFTIGQFLKTAVFGMKVGTWRQYNDDYDITVRLPLDQRTRIEDLYALRIPNNKGDPIPLSSLGTFRYTGGFGTIYRLGQDRLVTITGDNEGRQEDAVLRDVQARLARLDLPEGYTIKYAGEKQDQDEASAFLGKAFGIALLLIVLILVAQFNTLSVPLVIMTTVILSTIGVMVGLLVNGQAFVVIMTGVGVISLAGVVVNNAIVLLDYTRQLQRRGMDVVEASIQAGVTRLRPVLLTATTTILGLIPMATGFSFDIHKMAFATRSESSEWWAPMAWAVVYGLAFATVLTLVVVPTFYVALYRLASRFGLGGLRRAGEDDAAPEIVEGATTE